MFFFQPQQHSLSHLILIHMSYHEERCDTHEKEKTISRKKRYSIGGEFSIRMDQMQPPKHISDRCLTIHAISYLKSGMYTDSSAQSVHPAGRNCGSASNETHSKILPECCT